MNQEVYEFFQGSVPAVITLVLTHHHRGKHVLTRSFATKQTKPIFQIDGTSYNGIADYRKALKGLLFGTSGAKPSTRQLMPKFVRSSPALMSKTLKFLGDYTTDTDYEALHLFLFGFFEVDVLERRSALALRKKQLDRDWQALSRLRTEGEIEQLLIHLQREIQEIGLSPELRGEVPQIADRASAVTAIRSKASGVAALLSRYDSEIASLTATIDELQGEYSNIDQVAVESVYTEAQAYIPKLHHDWKDLSEFVKNLRARKQRFLESQIATLQAQADKAKEGLVVLQANEREQIGSLVKSPEFNKALQLRGDLAEKLKKLGGLEQDLEDRKVLKEKIASTEEELRTTQEQIRQGKALLNERVSIFNKYFSELSKVLYGEQYLLHFDETERGSFSFQLTAVGSNVGAGKKASQTAAFDLAYIKFLNETKIDFPTFVCHDGVEQIHGNQLAALLTEANQPNGQLVLATLRDKLPAMPDSFLQDNTVLELSQDDKLFKI